MKYLGVTFLCWGVVGVWEGAAGACGRTQAGSCHIHETLKEDPESRAALCPALPVSPVLLFDSVDVSRDVVP